MTLCGPGWPLKAARTRLGCAREGGRRRFPRRPRATGPLRRPGRRPSSRRSRAAASRCPSSEGEWIIRQGDPHRPSTSSSTARWSVMIDDEDRARPVEGAASSARCRCSWRSRRAPRSWRGRRSPASSCRARRSQSFLARPRRGDLPDPEGGGPQAQDGFGVAHLTQAAQEPAAQRPASRPGYLPIAEHGIIGDLHTAALVGTDGTIDWYCCPHFDSPSVFGAILDRQRGGYYRIAPGDRRLDAEAALLPRHQRPDHPLPDPRRALARCRTSCRSTTRPGSVFRHRLIRRVLGVRGELTFRDRGRAALQLRARPAHDRLPRERRGLPLRRACPWRWRRQRR